MTDSERAAARKLKVLGLACSLKPSPDPSSSQLLAEQVLAELRKYDVEGSVLRAVDYDIRPGVQTDMGDGDQWPEIRNQLLAADILLIATPIWLGHMCSVTQRVLERLDAELAETDDQGRPSMWNKVGVVAITGNEDGAHKITADVFQALDDIGFSIPAQGATYWVGEAMQSTDYNDLEKTPEKVASTTAALARNAAHLARALQQNPYPTS